MLSWEQADLNTLTCTANLVHAKTPVAGLPLATYTQQWTARCSIYIPMLRYKLQRDQQVLMDLIRPVNKEVGHRCYLLHWGRPAKLLLLLLLLLLLPSGDLNLVTPAHRQRAKL
jgi:hypothetical protein